MRVQYIAAIFIVGVVLIAASQLVTDRTFLVYMMTCGVWLLILSGILYRMYGRLYVRTMLTTAQKEQFGADLKYLAV